MIDIQEVKERMIKFIQDNGPCLPIHLSKHVGLEPMWGAAVLSELTDDKRVKMSAMKIGASSLFFLEGQEQQLEKFAEQHLSGILKEVYLLLKQRKYLEDGTQEPHVRVALRSLKDFAAPFKFNEKIMWRYVFTPTQEIQNLLEPMQKKQQEQQKQEQHHQEKQEEKAIENKTEKAEEQEEISFIEKIKQYLEKNKIKLIQEIENKKKDFLGIGRIDSVLGETELLIIGKDKKTIIGKDIEKIYKQITSRKKTGILLITGEIAKKDKESVREYKDVLKIEII